MADLNENYSGFTNWKLARKFLFFWGVIILSIFFIFLFFSTIFISLCLSIILWFLLDPLMGWIEKHGIGKKFAIFSLSILIFGLLVLGGVSLGPYFLSQLHELYLKIPAGLEELHRIILNLISTLQEKSFFGFSFNLDQLNNFFEFEPNKISATVLGAFQEIGKRTPGFVVLMLNLLLVPFFTGILLIKRNVIKKYFWDIVPKDLVEPSRELLSRLYSGLWSVTHGMGVVALIHVFLYMIVFWLADLPMVVSLGILVGLGRLAPSGDLILFLILGPILVLVEGLGFFSLITLGVGFIIIATLYNVLITPKIMGDKIGIDPFLLLLFVFGLAYWFGFFGVLLALPFACLLKVLVQSALPFYFDSKFFGRS